MIRRPPRSTLDRASAASDVYKRQGLTWAATAIQWGAPVPVSQPKWWQEAQRQGAYGAAPARSTVRRLLRKYDSLAEDIRVPEIELPERFRVLGLGKRPTKKHEQNGNE